jgi:hypothetical protein
LFNAAGNESFGSVDSHSANSGYETCYTEATNQKNYWLFLFESSGDLIMSIFGLSGLSYLPEPVFWIVRIVLSTRTGFLVVGLMACGRKIIMRYLYHAATKQKNTSGSSGKTWVYICHIQLLIFTFHIAYA